MFSTDEIFSNIFSPSLIEAMDAKGTDMKQTLLFNVSNYYLLFVNLLNISTMPLPIGGNLFVKNLLWFQSGL